MFGKTMQMERVVMGIEAEGESEEHRSEGADHEIEQSVSREVMRGVGVAHCEDDRGRQHGVDIEEWDHDGAAALAGHHQRQRQAVDQRVDEGHAEEEGAHGQQLPPFSSQIVERTLETGHQRIGFRRRGIEPRTRSADAERRPRCDVQHGRSTERREICSRDAGSLNSDTFERRTHQRLVVEFCRGS